MIPDEHGGDQRDSPDYTIETGIDDARRMYVSEGLQASNRARSNAWENPPETSSIQVYAIAVDGTTLGGVVGWAHRIPAWFEVTTVWVDEAHRGTGIGRALMARAEDEARTRGCRFVRFATADFQAPGFYERLGYALYGTLEDCPPGVTAYYYRKTL